jgi:hypothetical protein
MQRQFSNGAVKVQQPFWALNKGLFTKPPKRKLIMFNPILFYEYGKKRGVFLFARHGKKQITPTGSSANNSKNSLVSAELMILLLTGAMERRDVI